MLAWAFPDRSQGSASASGWASLKQLIWMGSWCWISCLWSVCTVPLRHGGVRRNGYYVSQQSHSFLYIHILKKLLKLPLASVGPSGILLWLSRLTPCMEQKSICWSRFSTCFNSDLMAATVKTTDNLEKLPLIKNNHFCVYSHFFCDDCAWESVLCNLQFHLWPPCNNGSSPALFQQSWPTPPTRLK